MTIIEIIIISFCTSFVYINQFNRINKKPFNCMMCLSGWLSMPLLVWQHGWMGLFWVPVVMVASVVFDRLMIKYLL